MTFQIRFTVGKRSDVIGLRKRLGPDVFALFGVCQKLKMEQAIFIELPKDPDEKAKAVASLRARIGNWKKEDLVPRELAGNQTIDGKFAIFLEEQPAQMFVANRKGGREVEGVRLESGRR